MTGMNVLRATQTDQLLQRVPEIAEISPSNVRKVSPSNVRKVRASNVRKVRAAIAIAGKIVATAVNGNGKIVVATVRSSPVPVSQVSLIQMQPNFKTRKKIIIHL